MHTDQTGVEDRIHSSYEEAVDDRNRKTGSTYRFRYDGRHSGSRGGRESTSPKPPTASTRGSCGPTTATATAPMCTESPRQLNRGANAVAEVAGAIKAAAKRIATRVEAVAEGVTAPGPIRTSAFRLHLQTETATISTARTSQSVLPTRTGRRRRRWSRLLTL